MKFALVSLLWIVAATGNSQGLQATSPVLPFGSSKNSTSRHTRRNFHCTPRRSAAWKRDDPFSSSGAQYAKNGHQEKIRRHDEKLPASSHGEGVRYQYSFRGN